MPLHDNLAAPALVVDVVIVERIICKGAVRSRADGIIIASEKQSADVAVVNRIASYCDVIGGASGAVSVKTLLWPLCRIHLSIQKHIVFVFRYNVRFHLNIQTQYVFRC